MEGSTGCYREPPRQPRSPWTEERIEYLRIRSAQGASGRQIARELGGGISRDAVLAKRQRLAIFEQSLDSGRHGIAGTKFAPRFGSALGHRPEWTLWRRPTPKWILNAKPYVEDPLVDADIPHSQRRSILELCTRTCRWPVGDPGTSKFFFCGADPLPGRPYCASHCARAYRPTGKAIRRAPNTGPRRAVFDSCGVDTWVGFGCEPNANGWEQVR